MVVLQCLIGLCHAKVYGNAVREKMDVVHVSFGTFLICGKILPCHFFSFCTFFYFWKDTAVSFYLIWYISYLLKNTAVSFVVFTITMVAMQYLSDKTHGFSCICT